MIIPPYPATHLLCEIYDSIDGNASDYDRFAGVARSFKPLPPPKSRSLGASSSHWIRPQQSHQHRTERKLPSPRLVRQIAQISAGRVDVPCPFENTGHCRSRIFRPHRLAGVLVGAWTDAQHRSDHHSPTHPTYLKVRLRQVFGEDLLLNSVIIKRPFRRVATYQGQWLYPATSRHWSPPLIRLSGRPALAGSPQNPHA